MSLLSGSRGLIVGCANERSLAYGIAQAAHQHGASLALTYQNERLAKKVSPLAHELDAALCMPLDLSDAEQLRAVYAAIDETWGSLDFLVHAVAHADPQALEGRYVECSREGFLTAMDISVYSLVELVRCFEPLLQKSTHNPSILTLSYLGSRSVVPNYNVMGVAKAALEATVRYLANDLGPSGIRVNALSPGPVKTLSAAGVRGLRSMLAHVPTQAPLRRSVDKQDVGAAAVFYLSSLSAGVTGEITAVDAGYNIMGAPIL